MALTINTKTFNRDGGGQAESALYAGPLHSITVSDLVEFKRVKPKAGGGTLGVARPTLRREKSAIINAATGETAKNLLRCDGSFHVGTTDADIEGMMADMAAWLGTTEAKAFFKTLVFPAS